MHPRWSLALNSFGNQSYIWESFGVFYCWRPSQCALVPFLWPLASRFIPRSAAHWIFIYQRQITFLTQSDARFELRSTCWDALNIYKVIGWSHPVVGSHLYKVSSDFFLSSDGGVLSVMFQPSLPSYSLVIHIFFYCVVFYDIHNSLFLDCTNHIYSESICPPAVHLSLPPLPLVKILASSHVHPWSATVTDTCLGARLFSDSSMAPEI